MLLLSSKDYFQINFFKKYFQEYYQNVHSLDLDQAGYFVWPDLGPNKLQRLSADATSRQRVIIAESHRIGGNRKCHYYDEHK